MSSCIGTDVQVIILDEINNQMVIASASCVFMTTL